LDPAPVPYRLKKQIFFQQYEVQGYAL